MTTLAERVRQKRESEGTLKASAKDEKAVAKTTKTATAKTTFTQVGSDGSLETYSDPFAEVTEDMIKRADELEAEILDQGKRVQSGYLRMAKALSEFKANKLYLAKGFSSFMLWADSPDMSPVGYRVAYNLVRIADEVIPLLAENNLLDQIPPISHLYELLPVLNDEDGEKKFLEALKRIKGLSVRDAKEEIRQIRGTTGNLKPTVFKGKVKHGDDFSVFVIFAHDGVNTYETGKLRIMKKDWARWEQKFGKKDIEEVD